MRAVALAAAMLVSACGFTPQGDLARDVIRERGAQAYDEGLDNALWYVCNAASIGSIRRRFGGSAASAEAYRAMCSPTADVIGPAR